MVGVIVSYFNKIDGTIIIYPKLKDNIVYLDDNNKIYVYKIKSINFLFQILYYFQPNNILYLIYLKVKNIISIK